ncbi:protein regulator of cytokinesis 1-like [Chelonus insularis]|uniref:protein regulator of cytokinesis 1-like n=1 Tax=Chelonus insularis TaxID=460826 RepID=UPI00158A27A9|nr:protein regulator of cytokinesis 1-like [Chelonus insularis]
MREEMALLSTNDFERLILDDSEEFIYSSKNMAELKKLHDNLQERRTIMKQEAESKRQELLELWKYLNVPKDQYEKILVKYSGFDAITIYALNKEIQKNMKTKEDNRISSFIKEMKENLKYWWSMCKMCPQEIEKLYFYNSTIVNENILKLHENEVEKLQEFYKSNKKLFELLDKWNKMWKQYKNYCHQIQNPDRYVNRRAQLLDEENTRNYLSKNLPKVKEQLEVMVNEYKIIQGKPFTIYGLELSEFFEKQIKDLQTEMKELKVAELKVNEEKSANKTLLSVSFENFPYVIKKKANTSPIKRKPRLSSSNIRKLAHTADKENVYPKVLCSKIRKSGHSKARRQLLSSLKALSRSPRM